MLRLKEILKEKDMTGKELAELVNVTQASISNIINGNHFPKPDLLKDIAKVLNIDVRDMFESTMEPKELTKLYIEKDGKYFHVGNIDKSKLE